MLISSPQEHAYALNFLTDVAGVGFTDRYFAFSPDKFTVFIYDTQIVWDFVIEIFNNSNITKYVAKLPGYLETILNNNLVNTYHINRYVMKYGDQRTVPDIKQHLIQLGEIKDPIDRISAISSTIMKYKHKADKYQRPVKKIRKNLFNRKRDAYLYILTLCNEILSIYGPMNMFSLQKYVSKYPNITRSPVNVSRLIHGLISIGAIKHNTCNNKLYLPDQLI